MVTNPVAVKAVVIIGLVMVGPLERTGPEVPVAGLAKPPATPVPKPAIPLMGRFVPFVKLIEVGVPKEGATRVALLLKTIAPVPVTFWPKAKETPLPNPVKPVIGSPTPLVRVTDEGVPNAGVIRVGELLRTTDPVPVEVVTPVPPLATGNTPEKEAVVMVLQANPVPFVQIRALFDPLQAGIVYAVGDALTEVTLATTELAAWEARLERPISPVAVKAPENWAVPSTLKFCTGKVWASAIDCTEQDTQQAMVAAAEILKR